MDYVSFVWDEKKADANYKKHKVTFEEAKTAFLDPNGRMIYDPGHSKDEERFNTSWRKFSIKDYNCLPLLSREESGH